MHSLDQLYPYRSGLGNLHGRLAFNQSFFVYVAALNFYPFFGYGRSIANSFPIIVLILGNNISLRSLLLRLHAKETPISLCS